MAAAQQTLRRRRLGEARERDADRRFQSARRPDLCRPSRRGARRAERAHLGDARQSRPIPGLCRRAVRHSGDDRRAARQSTEKNAAMRAFGARLVEHGSDFDEAWNEAMQLAEREQILFAPVFHRDLVLGVATWALELFRNAPPLEVLYVPIGLGSSI